jgi:hypothetical protein
MTLCPAKYQIREEAPGLKTEDVILCYLVRAYCIHQMSMQQWWNDDQSQKTEETL